MLLESLRNRRKATVGIMLATFIGTCLNVGIQSDVMASQEGGCHDFATQPAGLNSTAGDYSDSVTSCVHCPGSAPAIEEPSDPSLYICAVAAGCSADNRSSIIGGAEINIKPVKNDCSFSLPVSAQSAACRFFVQPVQKLPSAFLNIQYCRFLI